MGMMHLRERTSIDVDLWPSGTLVEDEDISVNGSSLFQLVDNIGSPAVVESSAIAPGHSDPDVPEILVGILLTRVLATAVHESGARILQLDSRLDNLRLVHGQAHLIGRRAGARQNICLAVRKPTSDDIETTTDVVALMLPRDIATGDLIAIPSRPSSREWRSPLHPLTGSRQREPNSIFSDRALERPRGGRLSN